MKKRIHKRQIPRSCAWFTVAAVLPLGRAAAAPASEPGVECVIVKSQSAPVQFAASEIISALKQVGWTVSSEPSAEGLTFTLTEPDGKGSPESFAVTVARDKRSVTVRGADVRGVMYGGLDVAEQIALGRNPASLEPRQQSAFLPVRGLKFNIPFLGNVYVAKEDQARSEWFYDLEFWRSFIRFLASNRYNLLTFWNSHPYDRMVRVRKYPEATSIPAEELDRNITFFHRLFGLAQDCGVDTSIVTWNIHCSPAFQKAHGVKDGQDSELIRDYQKECVKELLAEYPELTGIGTCPGEFMHGTAEWRENWIKETYLAGIRESGRPAVPFIHRAWFSEPPATIAMLKAAQYPRPVLLDIKFNGEHMYSSTSFHVLSNAWISGESKPYKLLWHLRNDCIFQLRWGDPDFASGVVRNCGGPGSAGFVMGSEIEVPGMDRNHTAESAPHKTWKYEFEKNWSRFAVWGRAGYNPDEPHGYWIARFGKHFGTAAGPSAFAALQAASKIIPLTTSFHWNYMNGDWYPEANIGSWNTSYEAPFKNYRDTNIWHNPLKWIFTHTIDNTLESIPDFVADRISRAPPPAKALTPPKVADQLDAAAFACEKRRRQAARKVTFGKEEWECTELDLKALEALGHYYAAKARGATELMFFLVTGDPARRAAAIHQLEQALTHWKELAAITSAHYRTHEIFLMGQFDWQRYTVEAEKDIQLVRRIAPWSSSQQTLESKSGGRPILVRSWQAESTGHKSMWPWVERFNARVATNLGAELHPPKVNAMLDSYYERLSAPHHLQAKSLDEWQQRREVVRRQTLRDIGLDPLPQRLPLDVHYGGTLDREDYVLRRLYFQTWPGVYASGWLYLPKTPGRHPAILNPHGHWENGAMHPVMQSCCLGLVKKGYVALTVDSVHLPADSFLVGASSIGAMTFNNIRALDLLDSLPEVDGTRLGCTGASGGGQQTMYLMAADDRIKAAVPAVLVSWFRRIMNPAGFPHCICNITPGILRDTDGPEMCATFASRPALFLSVTRDWTKAFPKEEFPEIRSIYNLYSQETAVDSAQWESDHDYSKSMRERMYAFFNHYLAGNDDPAAALEPPLSPESLLTLKALNQPPPVSPDASILGWYKSRFSAKLASLPDAGACGAYREALKPQLAALLGDVPVHGRIASASRSLSKNGLQGRQIMVSSESGVEFPALLLGANPSAKTALVILIHPKGGNAILQEYGEFVRSLQTSAVTVLLPDIRLTGALQRTWRLDGILWGRPETGMAVTDLRACVDALRPEGGSHARPVVLVGLGDAGFTATIAAVLEPRISAIVADRLGQTYAEGRQSPLIANLLRVGDLPELVAALAPRRVVLASVKPAQFDFASAVYHTLHAGPALELRAGPLPVADLTSSTLRALQSK